MSFRDDIREFSRSVETDSALLFLAICTAVLASIQFGSPITGAFGQPVDTGALRASWQLVFVSKSEALIATDKAYALSIELGIVTARSGQVTGHTGQRLTLRSRVGGFHSVQKTADAFDALVDDETRKLRGAA